MKIFLSNSIGIQRTVRQVERTLSQVDISIRLRDTGLQISALLMNARQPIDLHFFLEMRTRSQQQQQSRGFIEWVTRSSLGAGQRGEREGEVRACERDSDSETRKITLRFRRRYLRNRKSDRDDPNGVLKRKLHRFRQCQRE